jgi:GT2 family glycosyltransferase
MKIVSQISVIIPVKNDLSGIKRMVGCLRQQTVPHELIVVDNGSTDGAKVCGGFSYRSNGQQSPVVKELVSQKQTRFEESNGSGIRGNFIGASNRMDF